MAANTVSELCRV